MFDRLEVYEFCWEEEGRKKRMMRGAEEGNGRKEEEIRRDGMEG